MKNLFAKTTIVSSFLFLLGLPINGFTLENGRVISKGISYYHDKQSSGPLSYHVLEMNYPSVDYSLNTVIAGRSLFKGETVDQIISNDSKKNDIIAGVNGGYWSNGDRYVPTGLVISNGYLLRLPLDNRSAFLIDKDQKFYTGPVTVDINVSSGESNHSVKNLNPLSEIHESSLYTPYFGDFITESANSMNYYRMEPVAKKGFLPNEPIPVNISELKPENGKIKRDGVSFVLAKPKKSKKLVLGKGVLKASIKEFQGVVDFGVSGGPLLVKDGEFGIPKEKGHFASSFVTSRHPRTAIGYSKTSKRLYLVIVDGRQKNLSIGVSLKELSDYMMKLGCDSALNLDGGGSSTLVLKDKITNNPSDLGGARKVANCIIIVKNKSESRKNN